MEASMGKARAAVQRALQLDNTLADAHRLLGALDLSDWRWADAERELTRAIELDASNAEARRWYAYYLTCMGRVPEGITQIRRAVELDPLHAGLNSAAFWPFYIAGQYDQALEQLLKARALDPNFNMSWILLGRVYTAKHMYDEAIASFNKVIDAREQPTLAPFARALLGQTLALSGRRREALAIARDFDQNPAGQGVAIVMVAMSYNALGDHDKAIELLERGYVTRRPEMFDLKVDPVWNSLRSDPRFQSLVRRMGFPN
jgi:tetratricopeptide (TPR) repeat protein